MEGVVSFLPLLKLSYLHYLSEEKINLSFVKLKGALNPTYIFHDLILISTKIMVSKTKIDNINVWTLLILSIQHISTLLVGQGN